MLKELTPILHNAFLEIEKETASRVFNETSNLNTKIKQRQEKQKKNTHTKQQTSISLYLDAKFLSKMQANIYCSTFYKRIKWHDQGGFLP